MRKPKNPGRPNVGCTLYSVGSGLASEKLVLSQKDLAIASQTEEEMAKRFKEKLDEADSF